MSDYTAYTYAKYKIKEETNKFDDIGLFTKEEFKEKFLINKFSKSESEVAIHRLVKEEILDKYYIDICDNCSTKQLIKEESPSNFETNKEIINGYKCRHCKKEIHANTPIFVKFSISNDILESEDSETETLFDKIKKVLIPWKSK